jgi:protein-histidine pros-kinase
MGLRLKFNLVLLTGLLVGLGLAAALSYTLIFAEARRDVLSEAALMDAQAAAISRYTADEIAPLVANQFARRFLPQSVPAWAAQTNFRAVQAQLPDYGYRTVVLDPTNPADLPADWQRTIIDQMRSDSSLKRVVTERGTPSGPILSVSRPIIITDQACLACHSTPQAAPASLIDLYGNKNGFNWKLNEVLGASIVSVPMSVPLNQAWAVFGTVLIWLAAVFLLMLVLLNVMLEFAIIRPVRRISASANEVSLGNMDAPEYPVRGRDEIASLAESFNRMRRSLANALKMLDE